MVEAINIYCDESTHLPNDGMPFLVLGAISCPVAKAKEVSTRLREIIKKHDLPEDFEIKWSKVSETRLPFYRDIVDYFFDDDDLSFRVVVAPKGQLRHQEFNQTHDDWYYKMMFYLVRGLLQPGALAYIYLDKKDTRGGDKVRKLHEVIANSYYDFDQKIIRRVQIVESHHVIQIQLADLLLGAVNYKNRALNSNTAKLNLVSRIQERSGYALTTSTLPSEPKFNVFAWRPRGVQ